MNALHEIWRQMYWFENGDAQSLLKIQGDAGHPLGEADERIDHSRMVEQGLAPRQLLARQEDGALSEHVPGVHEDRDPVHGSKRAKRKRLPKEPL